MSFRSRFRRGNSLRPINRIKHVVDVQGGITAGTASNQAIIATTDTPTLGVPTSVETGCTVNGIYLKFEINATSSAALANFYLIIWKNPGGNITNIVPNTVGTNDNKRFVIHQEMVMLQQVTNSNPRTVFNGVIVIPKGYRRFAPNDTLLLSFLSPGVNMNFCFQVHYKEFR